MAQTFFPIDPVEVTPGFTGWQDVNVSAHIPEGATGVVLHVVNNSGTYYNIGLRKNGSTDDRDWRVRQNTHRWAAIGVDVDRIFEASVGHTTSIDIYVVAYTMAGVAFHTNAEDKSLGVEEEWTDIDCHVEAPDAIGLIFEDCHLGGDVGIDFRKNGSSDDRTTPAYYHNTMGVIIGCDASQICEGYRATTGPDYFLLGYITDGCTFNLNATDVSLADINTWLDLAALPANANMGFIEVSSSNLYAYGLRKNNSDEDIYYDARFHPWAFVECDDSQIIEGKIENIGADFFVVGYSIAAAGRSRGYIIG